MNKIRKQHKDEKEHEEEKYKFIKEQIRPQRKKYALKFLRGIVTSVVFALVFGSVSGVVFWKVNKELNENVASTDGLISTMQPDYSSEPYESTSTLNREDLNDDENDNAIIEEKNRVSKKLAAVGEKFASSLVRIINKSSKVTWYSTDSKSDTVLCGMIFRETGRYYYLLTSNIVLSDEKIAVEFDNGETVDAKYISSESNLNLAVLQIVKSDISIEQRNRIEIPQFGSTVKLPVGSNVIAVGAPNGVMYSVMTGSIIKSNIETPITDNEISLFSTDIHNTHGANGIIINTRGRVLGFINDSFESLTGSTSIGFIGVSSIIDIIGKMVKNETVSYLGIEGRDVSQDTANYHKLDVGVYVTSVYSGSPAYIGGMRVADVITEIDGKSITTLYELHNLLKSHKSGDNIAVTVSRKSDDKVSSKKLNVTLG